ncbi:MAG: hypothetical protein HY023_05895 [Chloroflexi bacterium]|nr:hypothetical protein [Chloroflexota bacterium]
MNSRTRRNLRYLDSAARTPALDQHNGPRESFPPEAKERVLGAWAVHYLPPWGGNYPGHLEVTDGRACFLAEVKLSLIRPTIIGPVNSRTIAALLDLDPAFVPYEGNCLFISIPKSQIECAAPARQTLSNCVSLTLKNNGSIQLFDKGLLPATPLLKAIQSHWP